MRTPAVLACWWLVDKILTIFTTFELSYFIIQAKELEKLHFDLSMDEIKCCGCHGDQSSRSSDSSVWTEGMEQYEVLSVPSRSCHGYDGTVPKLLYLYRLDKVMCLNWWYILARNSTSGSYQGWDVGDVCRLCFCHLANLSLTAVPQCNRLM